MRTGAPPRAAAAGADTLTELIAKHAGRANLSTATTIDELGLSSLERVELMVALEDAFQTHLDEGAFSGARDVGQLRALVEARVDERVGRGRADRVPVVESVAAGARHPPREPADVAAAAGARVRVDPRRGARAPGVDQRAR